MERQDEPQRVGHALASDPPRQIVEQILDHSWRGPIDRRHAALGAQGVAHDGEGGVLNHCGPAYRTARRGER